MICHLHLSSSCASVHHYNNLQAIDYKISSKVIVFFNRLIALPCEQLQSSLAYQQYLRKNLQGDLIYIKNHDKS